MAFPITPWTLIGSASSSLSAGAGPGAAAPLLPCSVEALSQQDFLDLFDRILPNHYIEPLKSPGPGYEALQAFASLMSRLSLSVERLSCAAFILSSTGGAYAVGEVELFRAVPNGEGISVVVKAGTVVSASRSGRRFKTTADVTFAPGDLGPFTVGVVSELQGYEFNLPGIVVAADGALLEGEIDTIDTLVEDPDMGDLNIQVRQTSTETAGGVDPSLDQQGLDRGIARLVAEEDAPYRGRVRSLPDNISPSAFDRVMLRFLQPVGAVGDLIETWDISYQTCWDGPGVSIAGSNYDPNLFVFDDPRAPVPFRNRWLGEDDYRGGLIIVVPNLVPISDYGMVYDDVAMNAAQLASLLGSRALGAYDVPASLNPSFGLLHGFYDAGDIRKQALYKGLYDTMQDIKAAGISAVLELQGN